MEQDRARGPMSVAGLECRRPLAAFCRAPGHWTNPTRKEVCFRLQAPGYNQAVAWSLLLPLTVLKVLGDLRCSVAQSCPTLFNPMVCSTPSFSVLHISWNLLKLMSIELVMPSNRLVLCCPLLLPSIFSLESALRIRWPKVWSFSFSISPSNKYSGLISFRIDLLAAFSTQPSFWCS